MSSKPRQFEIGKIYHIIKRGVDGRKIYLKSQDYSRFILGLEFFNDENPVELWNLLTRAVGRSDLPTNLPTNTKSLGVSVDDLLK